MFQESYREMLELIINSIYYLGVFAHPVGFAVMFVASLILFKSGFRYAAVAISLPSLAVVITTIMAWVTTSTEPVEETLPNGTYHMYFEQSIWEQIQYPVYIWSTFIVSVAFFVLALQIRNRLKT
jgi:hypothetical protein